MIHFSGTHNVSNAITLNNASVAAPDLTARNFCFVIGGYMGDQGGNSGRIFGIQSTIDGTSNPRPVLGLSFLSGNNIIASMGRQTGSDPDTYELRTVNPGGTNPISGSDVVPWLAVIVVRSSTNFFSLAFKIGATTTRFSSTTVLDNALATRTADGVWGIGAVPMDGITSATSRNLHIVGPMILTYADSAHTPDATTLLNAIYASQNVENIVDPSFSGYSANGTPTPVWRMCYGTYGHTAHSIKSGVDRAVSVDNLPSWAAGDANLRVYKHRAGGGTVTGTHVFRDPFTVGNGHWEPRELGKTISGTTPTPGIAPLFRAILTGSPPKNVRVGFTGQSWSIRYANSYLEPVEADLALPDNHAQAFAQAFDSKCIGVWHQPVIASNSSTSRSAWGNRKGFAFNLAQQPSDNGTLLNGTSAGADNTNGWNRFGMGGDNAQNGPAGNLCVGGPVWRGDLGDAIARAPLMWFDPRTCGGVSIGDPIEINAYFVRYPHGPRDVIAAIYLGSAQTDDWDTGTPITSSIQFSLDSGGAEGTVTDSFTPSAVAFSVSGLLETDVDVAEIIASAADVYDPDLPRWGVYNEDRNELNIIVGAGWNAGTDEWTFSFSPSQGTVPQVGDTVHVGRVEIIRVGTDQLSPGAKETIVTTAENPLIGVNVEATMGSLDNTGYGPVIFTGAGAEALNKNGFSIGGIGTGGSPYTTQAASALPWVQAQYAKLAGVNCFVMVQAGTESARKIYSDNYAENFPDADIVWVWEPNLSSALGGEADNDTQRADMRANAASDGIAAYDGVNDWGTALTATMRGYRGDATHGAAYGYYRWYLGELRTAMLAAIPAPPISGGHRGRNRGRGRPIGWGP